MLSNVQRETTLEPAFDHADRVEYNVCTVSVRDLEHFLLPIFLRVVNRVMGTALLGNIKLRLRPCCSDDLRAKCWQTTAM